MNDSPEFLLCPYCGLTQKPAGRCSECGGLFEPLSRRATQIAMGPWYIRDRKRPFQPGFSYDVLKKQVRSGRITRTTVLRGPTTRQFWSVAMNVPGVAHLLGYCHACGTHVPPGSEKCTQCGARFQEVPHRNELGLQFPTEEEARAAQQALERELAGEPPAPAAAKEDHQGAGDTSTGSAASGGDLLSETLGTSAAPSAGAAAESPGAHESGSAGSKQRSSSILTFEDEHTPSPESGGGPRSQALEFSTGGATSEAHGDQTPEPAPAASGPSATALALIVINVLAAGVAITLIIVSMMPESASEPDESAAPPARAPADVDRFFEPDEPAPESDGRAEIDPEDPHAEAIRQARDMEAEGRIEAAHAYLRDRASATPIAERTDALEREIRRLDRKLGAERTERFFEH